MTFSALFFALGMVAGPGLVNRLGGTGRSLLDTSSTPLSEDPLPGVQPLCGAGLLGGYQPVPLPNDQVQELAGLALRQYIGMASAAVRCKADIEAAVRDVDVVAACRQVVAGTNWVITMDATLPCTSAVGAPGLQQVMQRLEATVFVPLPNMNAPPQVISVQQRS